VVPHAHACAEPEHLQYWFANQPVGRHARSSATLIRWQGHLAVLSLGTVVYGLDLADPKGRNSLAESLIEGETMQ